MKNMVDICGGKMTLEELSREIYHYMLMYKPDKMVIEIKMMANGYHAYIWIPKKDWRLK